MGTSRSVAEMSAKMDRAARGIDRASREAIETAAKETKRVTVELMAKATGGDLALSGTTRTTGPKRSTRSTPATKGKIGVNYKVERRPAGDQALVRATGPAQLVENDVKRHVVVSRYAKASERVNYIGRKGNVLAGRSSRQARNVAVMAGIGTTGDRRAVLRWGGTNYARWTTASSKGRHPWRNGIAQMRPRIPGIVATANRKAIVREFGP